MPTREERLAQIDAALRERFFPLLPKIEKPGRERWEESQHDKDRLSRSLAAYTIAKVAGLNDALAANAVTDGSNDGGIDAIYFSPSKNRLFIVQAKYKITGTAPAQDETLKTINGIRSLQSRRFNEFSEAFRFRSDELELALDTPGVVIHIYLAFLGDIVGQHATNDLNALCNDMNLISERMKWEPAGLEKIHNWFIEEQEPSPIAVDVTLENWHRALTPRMAIYGQISVAELANLVGEHGTELFQRNIRHYLGSIGVNASITKSVLRRPQDFFYLNNGLTAVAEDIQQAGGDQNRCVFNLTNISIVNGAQTAGAVTAATLINTISPDAKVLITIIKIGIDDALGFQITKARNHQTAVRGVDFAALDPNQERIRRELAVAGINYYYRPSEEARVRTANSLTLEDSALAQACLSLPVMISEEIRQRKIHNRPSHNAVDFVVTAKKSVARLWEQTGNHYKQLFHQATSGLSVFRQVQIFRFIDSILHGSEWSEHSYNRQMFFRHGRYFIMAFVGKEASEILQRTDLDLSENDKTVLSRLTNEISELIYSTSEPLQSVRGYLSIFRNLTDSEPRILLEDSEKSYHAPHRVGENDNFDNKLIFGDNLLALKALEQDYAGKVKCIYIDPPYNTGSAFDHYDDGLEHSLWLSLVRARISILWNLLESNGSIWISIDDREMAYLKILLDEICGRDKFIAANIWQKRYSRENREAIGDVHEYILVYAKSPKAFKTTRNRVPLDEKSKKVYKNTNNDPRGPWRSIPMTAQGFRPNQMYTITAPNGATHIPPEGRCWSTIEKNYKKLLEQGRIYFGKNNNSQPNIIRYLDEVAGHVPWTWWTHEEVGHTDEAKKEVNAIFGKDSSFSTPKPERLLSRILHIATNPGDVVLDSFLGSGTTAAVAQKMGRRWIGIELGEHCHTHCIPRLKKVIDGVDPGGITNAVHWKGGGGFRYYKLAPSLLEKDKWENWVISKDYNAAMLTEAVCKLEGFTYAPSDVLYWKHGYSTEQDFIYVTTANLKHAQLQQLSDELGTDRSLLVVCTSFRGSKNGYPNLTVKKIPKAVLTRCEWGKDDYSLRVENLPAAPPELGQQDLGL